VKVGNQESAAATYFQRVTGVEVGVKALQDSTLNTFLFLLQQGAKILSE
jgi:hypothetical protein